MRKSLIWQDGQQKSTEFSDTGEARRSTARLANVRHSGWRPPSWSSWTAHAARRCGAYPPFSPRAPPKPATTRRGRLPLPAATTARRTLASATFATAALLQGKAPFPRPLTAAAPLGRSGAMRRRQKRAAPQRVATALPCMCRRARAGTITQLSLTSSLVIYLLDGLFSKGRHRQ